MTASARKQLASVLRAALTRRYRVLDAPVEVDALEARKPVVQVIRTELEPGTRIGERLNTFAVWLIQPRQIESEDALDNDLDELLAAIDSDGRLLWTRAERSTFVRGDDGSDTYPAYRLTITLATSVQPKE